MDRPYVDEASRVTLRVVLDSNIWLDWVYFDDPLVRPLKSALQASRLELIINAACLDEFARVLAYDRFALDTSTQASHLATVRRCARIHVGPRNALASTLPVCADPDDQKFLELARDAGAHWLVTKDRALLTLMRKKYRLTNFRIATPAEFVGTIGKELLPVA